MVEIEIKAILQNGLKPKNFQIFMSEVKGFREFSFFISTNESKSLLTIFNNKETNISTYKLYINTLEKLNVHICKSEILHYENSEFYTQLVLKNIDNTLLTVGINITNTIILSLLTFCPIMIDNNCLDILVYEQADMPRFESKNNDPLSSTSKNRAGYGEVQTIHLEKMLSQAVEQEDYEKAMVIRNELEKRKDNKA